MKGSFWEVLVFGRAKWSSIKCEMGLSARKLGLEAVQTRKTSAIFLNHDQRSFRALPAPSAAPRSPLQAERESLIQLLTSTTSPPSVEAFFRKKSSAAASLSGLFSSGTSRFLKGF